MARRHYHPTAAMKKTVALILTGLLASLSLSLSAAALAMPNAASDSDSASSSAPPTDPQAYAKLPVCKLSDDGKRLAVEPCRTAPAKVPMPRRPVTQIIQRMPRSTAAPQVAMPSMPPSPSLESLTHPSGAPVPVSGCGAGGCYAPNGAPLNSAGPGAVVSPSGKVCNRSGAWVQC
jgi:hypothetical protein